jgi:hypothetical protein
VRRTARVTIQRHCLLAAAAIVCGFTALVSTPVAGAATTSGAVISNGTVQLGVNDRGDLNYNCVGAGDTGCPDPSAGNGSSTVGLRYVPLNLDAISPGCPCEGWGLADAGSELTGYANESAGDANITVDSFNAPSATEAISTVTIADAAIPGYQMQIVQDYHPSPLSPNLFVDSVTVTNTGTNTLTDLRYRRAMDWDVEPTAFEEWVTIQGTSPQLLFDSDNGFASSDPLSGPSYIDSQRQCGAGYTGPCQFTDLGGGGSYPTVTNPRDHGALFDFGLGQLAAGESRSFNIYYGAADSETAATAALSAGGAQVYSLGKSNCTGDTIATCFDPTGNAGVEQGKPATFMFGFDIPKPDTVIDDVVVNNASAETTFHGVWQVEGSSVRVLRCQIDSEPEALCTSPAVYNGLAPGPHRFQVRAVEDGRWDPTPAVSDFTIQSPDFVSVDGGPDYYSQFSYSLPGTNWFPRGVWGAYDHTDQNIELDKSRGLDLNIWPADTSVPISRFEAHGMPSLLTSDWYGLPGVATSPANAGYVLADEVDMQLGPGAGYDRMQQVNDEAPSDGRIRYANYGKGIMFWETDQEAARFVNEFQDITAVDIYWFTDPHVSGIGEGGAFFGLNRDLTYDETRRASNYGRTVDRVRYLDGLDGVRHPIWTWIEVGWPFTETAAQGARTIQPAEVRAAVWHSIIAGARGIGYFNHSFGGPCTTHHVLRDPCYSQIQQMVTSVNAQIAQLAPVLNAPFDTTFVSASPSVRVMAKDLNGTHYVFAGSWNNVASDPTFTVRSGSEAAVEGEGRTIPIVNGQFTDHFADGNAIHIYRIQ